MRHMYEVIIVILLISMAGCKSSDDHLEIERESLIFQDSILNVFPVNELAKLGLQSSNAFNSAANVKHREFTPKYYVEERIFSNDSVFKIFKSTITSYFHVETGMSDSTWFLIGNEDKLYSRYDKATLNKYFEQDLSYFVLDFHTALRNSPRLHDTNTTLGISDDFETYIIKSGFQNILPESISYNWMLLPEKYKHGYTCGLSLSSKKQKVLYWIVAW